MKNLNPQQIRQGDVQLQLVKSLPEGCKEVPNDKGRIVLAYGEVTGHAHAIADHRPALRAGEIAEAAIARARLLVAPNGERFLEVKEAVTLRHEEHSPHTLNPGVYQLPRQVEYVAPDVVRAVED